MAQPRPLPHSSLGQNGTIRLTLGSYIGEALALEKAGTARPQLRVEAVCENPDALTTRETFTAVIEGERVPVLELFGTRRTPDEPFRAEGRMHLDRMSACVGF